ncbi:class I SAM-dependent methyltransferase [Alteromonas sp. W364]|uniref:class I SAM-dependent methyltransferase n=1 Tax=Alteromonas sp. W364 TaxID=3075610 RepID=UPI0028837B78|nr:class I SAM-dependent methyltransferase [Alteromonas sp. W364]MDT0628319.1 class I SAM-dependent methyltransferase [Alteromonas sp. W364]
MINESKAWDLYWETGALESCVTQSDELVQSALETLWTGFVSDKSQTQSLLDLATGNGSVLKILVQVQPTLQLTGVDQAKITAHPSIVKQGSKNVALISNVDIKNMEFKDQTFDFITSQFGLEYALDKPISVEAKALVEINRLLKPSGSCQFLIHHADSALVKSNKARQKELHALLSENGLITHLSLLANGHSSIGVIEKVGQDYLAMPTKKTKAISGQVFEAVAYFIQRLSAGETVDELKEQIDQTVLRIEAEYSRLSQLIQAALSEKDFANFCSVFQSFGFDILKDKPFEVVNQKDSFDLLGWQFLAQKSGRA